MHTASLLKVYSLKWLAIVDRFVPTIFVCHLPAGALAEAVAQQADAHTVAAAAASAAAAADPSRHAARSQSLARPSASPLKPAPLQLLQHQDSGGPLSSSRASSAHGAAGSARSSLAHSATAAARLARQASSKSAAAQTGVFTAASPAAADLVEAEFLQCMDGAQQDLELQLATANAQLASALATARQVSNTNSYLAVCHIPMDVVAASLVLHACLTPLCTHMAFAS